jgi:glycosyltransferase involved in cell wall biosynthesis
MAHWARNKPIVWEMNASSDYCSMMWRAEGRRVDLQRMDDTISKQARNVELAICNTRGLEQYARQIGIRRSTVIPLGSDPELFDPNVPCCKRIRRQGADLNIIWCGSAEIRWHDLDLILSAAKLLIGERRIQFFMVGKMDRLPGCPANITFLGEVPREDLPSILSCMDVGLALYRKPSWSRFGVYSSPLKLFEYMASGLIVMASPIEQVEEVIRDGVNGFLIPFGDSTALAACLSKVARREVDSQEIIGSAARDMVIQYYNWRRVAGETAAEIETVLTL